MPKATSSFVLTPRDSAICCMTYDYHGVSFDLLYRRFFPHTEGGRVSCVTRIGQLVKHNFLVTRRLPSETGFGSGKLFITLGVAGRQRVAEERGVSQGQLRQTTRADSVWFVPHKLAVAHVRLSFELAALQTGDFHLNTWTADEELRHAAINVPDPRHPERTVPIVPDSVFGLVLPDATIQGFYLEVDRGTVPGKRVRHKLDCYLMGDATPVLWVAPTATRASAIVSWAIAAAAKRGQDPTIFWVTIAPAVNEVSVFHQPIWQIAGGPDAISLQELAQRPPASSAVTRTVPQTVSVQGVLPL